MCIRDRCGSVYHIADAATQAGLTQALGAKWRSLVVEGFDVIDAAGLSPDGRVGLMMFEHRDWSNPAQQLQDLHKKCQAYLSYAIDGDMARDNPEYAGKSVWIRLVAQVRPPSHVIPYPVSYTHLDVYKRQYQNSGLRRCAHIFWKMAFLRS